MISGTDRLKYFVMTILYVDDDSDDRELLTEALMVVDPSIACNCFDDGRRALDTLKGADRLPDLILLDINMPGMNGRECLAEIKKDKRLRNVPVIMYSTSNDVDEISLFYQLGAAYIHKPDTFKGLCTTLVKLLRSYRASPA